MAKREPVIKYYDNKESHGMIIDWSKVWREYNKLKVPGEFFSPVGTPVEKAKYIVEMSERSTGKTTNWLLVGMILYRMYGTVIQYVRATDDQIKPSVAKGIFNVILGYENGRYIEEITDGEFNGIYIHWQKAYFCHYNEEGERDRIDDNYFMCYLSIQSNYSYKSVYNEPTGDLILFDEFIGKNYQPNEFIQFLDLVSTIRRARLTPVIVMLSNTINPHSEYFKEMEITKEVNALKVGKSELVTTKGGTKIFIEAIGGKKSKLKELGNMLFYGFKNPRIATITGGDDVFAFDNYPHISFDEENDVVIDRRLKLDTGTTLLSLDIVFTEDRGYVINVHECTRTYPDSVILTLEEIWDKQHIWGIGNSSYLKFVWNLYKQNKFYYQDNSIGSLVEDYIHRYLKEKR